MKVSFIIPVYGHLELTQTCVQSLRDTVSNVDYELIIVDDGSDGTCKAGLDDLKDARTRIVKNDKNRGYAYSNNAGAAVAKGEILFLLNNDLTLLKGWFAPMLKAFEKRTNVGAVGNVQLDSRNGNIDHSGYYVDWNTKLLHKRETNHFGLFKKSYSRFHLITGACFAIKRKTFQDIGGFDEGFLNGCEDIDLCLKLGQKKLKILVANKSIIKHAVSSTRSDRNLAQEQNARRLQKLWKDRLAQLAAYRWPNYYLSKIWNNPRSSRFPYLLQATTRILGIKKGAAKAGLHLANWHHLRNERHWKSILDNWTDDMIKNDEQRTRGNWLKDQFKYSGLYSDKTRPEGLWIRNTARFQIPRGLLVDNFRIRGYLYPADNEKTEETGALGLKISVNGDETKIFDSISDASFDILFENPPVLPDEMISIEVELLGVAKTNAYAFLGRKFEKSNWVPKGLRRHLTKFRSQNKNKRLTIQSLEINDETLLDFKTRPASPLIFDYALKYGNVGINLVGWFKAQLGIGESVRLAAKALQSTRIGTAFVPLKANCLAAQGDDSYDHLLQETNPYGVNIFHIDAPQSPDIDHHHGPQFRKDRYNVAYWAWELPEFPDNWIQYFSYFDEIWTPSDFVTRAITMKSPIPVLTIPHCIDFEIPNNISRKRFNLPEDKFLFLFAYDLNSYQERKNPQATIRAFKKAFVGSSQDDVGLVIKTQSSRLEHNKDDFQNLLSQLEGIDNVYLIDETLSRSDVYGLMNVCDCYVSLHRSEGFGLTVAESMFLEKPVISTHWSATSEFLNTDCGLPVNCELIELTHTFGPYQKGQIWAEPNNDHAAEQMAKIKNDADLAKRLGTKAKEIIKQRFSPKAVGNLYEQRLKTYTMWG